MIRSSKGILIALAIPILALAMLVAYKKYILSVGKVVTLPITGYDPRDLLSGHYLVYTINYGLDEVCQGSSSKLEKPAYICLNPKKFSYHWPNHCNTLIKGTCKYSRFKAGVERFYVPEKDAKKLEELIQSNNASIVLSIFKNGKAQIKDLLIDGTTWREHELK